MLIHTPTTLPVAALRASALDLKKPMGKDAREGLRAGIDEFGFSAVLNVAKNLDNTYSIIDGNSRLDELKASGVVNVSCIVHDDMAEGFPDWQNRRKSFALSYDTHRKGLDKKAAITAITDMIAAGADGKVLEKLSGFKGLDKLVSDTKDAAEKVKETLSVPVPTLDSIVIMGPAEQIKSIRENLDAIHAGMTTSEKLLELVREARLHLDITSEAFLTVFLHALFSHLKS